MNNIKQWLKNLRKPEPRFSVLTYSEEHLKHAHSDWDKEYHTKRIQEGIPDEIVSLRKHLARALRERKTCTPMDFNAQLEALLSANSALAHQKLLGINENSEMTRIVTSNYAEEMAKLWFLVFDNIDDPEDVMEQKVEAYMSRERPHD